jgi:hypothetical protein
MKRALGFRVEPSGVNWAVIEDRGGVPALIAAESASAPTTYDEAHALAYYRERVLFIVQNYAPDIVAVRYPEPVGRTSGDAMRRRARIEGVVLEAAASEGLSLYTGALVTISSSLKTKSAKTHLNEEEFRGLDWAKYNGMLREAMLVAIASMESQRASSR